MGSKFAIAVLSASMVTLQVEFVPLHAPDHPANTAPSSAVAVKVTGVPSA